MVGEVFEGHASVRDSSRNWKRIFVVISVIYFISVVGIPLLLQQIQGYVGLKTGLGVFVDNAKLNSLADFISGVFAPLAFLWLVAAVMIQSDELKLQRQEIAENRTVLREQAAAASENVSVAKRMAKENMTLQMHERRVSIYLALRSASYRIHSEREGSQSASLFDSIIETTERGKFLFDHEVYVWLNQLSEAAHGFRNCLDDLELLEKERAIAESKAEGKARLAMEARDYTLKLIEEKTIETHADMAEPLGFLYRSLVLPEIEKRLVPHVHSTWSDIEGTAP